MRHARIALLLVLALLLVCSTGWNPAEAACAADGLGHPAVTFIFGQTTDPATCDVELTSGCGAVLISPTVAITSALCAQEWSTASGGAFDITAVWLSHDPSTFVSCVGADRVASWHIHPDWGGEQVSPFNIAAIVLEAPSGSAPATLPAAGDVSNLLRGDPLDVVAYSSEGSLLTTLRRDQAATFARATAVSFRVRTAGKACPAPEGGGVFLPSSQDILGMSIGSRRGFLRLDIPAVRDFLSAYVTLP